MEQFHIGMDIRDVVTAKNMNEIADAVNWVEENNQLNQKGVSPFAGVARDGKIRVKNGTEVPMNLFSAAELTDLVLTAENCDSFAFETPTFVAGLSTGEGAPWALVLEQAQPGELAKALVSGIAPAKVNIRDTAHLYVRPVVNSETGALESCGSGTARILFRGGTSGDQWCIVQMGVSPVGCMLHAPFHISLAGGTAANVINISAGFASRNGTTVFVPGGTVTVNRSGYVMLRSPFTIDGWGDFQWVVIRIAGGSVSITDEDFPLGYVTFWAGTVTDVESYHPTMAIFTKTTTCDEDADVEPSA